MKRTICVVLLCLGLFSCNKNRPSAKVPSPAPPQTKAAALPAPALLSPAADAALHLYPRTLTLEWSPVDGATQYRVEIDCYGCCAPHAFCGEVGRTWRTELTKEPSYTFNFVGDQPGRWRVWAIAADSGQGVPSEWRRFTFGKVIAGSIIPPVIPPAELSEVVPCPSTWRPGNQAGAGMTVARPLYHPDPDYTDAARKDKVNGTVTLGIMVGEDGQVKDVCVVKSLRPDLDGNAVGTVKTWRFDPARKDGAPISTQLSVEINYRIYR